ncbi:MAG: tRNA lysidine(34) synthetase TilS, partial [Desulfobacterales bacterium]|nr:tRNA lysidine(34) synthetase TilS [Desulfobacterales bacterium]
LAHVLSALALEYSLRLAIAHLNHCLRGRNSERDAEFAAAFARQIDLPFYTQKGDVHASRRSRKLSLEEAARKIRYEFYDAVAARYGFNKIALGHHSDDNAELVLMNLLRGSGPLGLSGIAPVRDGKIVRPLIYLKQSEIFDYLAANNLRYVTDASNTNTKFQRNKIRHQLIPELQNTYNPRIIESLNRLGSIMRAEDQWFEDVLKPSFERCVLVKTSDKISLSISYFGQQSQAANRRIIRKAILSVKKDLRRITLFHVDAVLELIKNGPITGSLSLPDGIRVQRNAAELIIVGYRNARGVKKLVSSQSLADDFQYTISAPGTLNIKKVKLSMLFVEIGIDDLPALKDTGGHLAFFDMDCVLFPLIVRNVRPGDRFSPLGVDGTQKVKKFFSDHKFTPAQRKQCPLVLSRDKIIWIAGHRIDNSVKVGPHTRRVLKAELLLA